jgi:hypothetical protein
MVEKQTLQLMDIKIDAIYYVDNRHKMHLESTNDRKIDVAVSAWSTFFQHIGVDYNMYYGRLID